MKLSFTIYLILLYAKPCMATFDCPPNFHLEEHPHSLLCRADDTSNLWKCPAGHGMTKLMKSPYCEKKLPSRMKSFNVFSPSGIKQFYYQFSDSLVNSTRSLGLKSVQLQSHEDVVTAGLGPNDVVLILADLNNRGFSKEIVDTAALLKEKGVHIVVYETEPVHGIADPNKDHRYLPFNPIAIWAYNPSHVEHLHRFAMQPYFIPVACVPPGYSRVVDYRLHPSRGTKNPVEVVALVSFGAVVRLGNLPKVIPTLRNVGAWTHAEFAAKVTSRHVAINVHKGIQSKNLEMFRFAPMLSSGMRVVSEHSSMINEQFVGGLVTFENRSDFPSTVSKFLDEAKNETARLLAEEKISSLFRQRFDLTMILFDQFCGWSDLF
mmetsp:Transcript_25826/g.51869  ORF Transcript_25826/g.51869 Transcript_25826/m.51869 type:complete len:377 (-) Transcript_25826:92-1222(-)